MQIKICSVLAVLMLCVWMRTPLLAQDGKAERDTFACPIIGFNVGVIHPMSSLSFAKGGDVPMDKKAGTIADLYDSPFLNFGVDAMYLSHSGWLYSADFNFFFGNDNLTDRVGRMPNVFTRDSIIVGTNGVDAVVTCYNRGLFFGGGFGRLFRISRDMPNSGPFAKVNVGWFQHKTVFMKNEVNAPQVDGDYARLYDHRRRGLMLSEDIGFWYMNDRVNLVNLYVALEFSQCWTVSARDYVIDDKIGLRGPDNRHYFDFMVSLKVSWMFPLKRKMSHEYYYY